MKRVFCEVNAGTLSKSNALPARHCLSEFSLGVVARMNCGLCWLKGFGPLAEHPGPVDAAVLPGLSTQESGELVSNSPPVDSGNQ